MPSDNLEHLFRDKVEEVQHTPPPQFSWTPEKSWKQLQPLLPAPRRKSTPTFYLGVAAGLVLALLAGLSLYRISETRTPASAVVVTSSGKLPESPSENVFKKPERSPEELSKLLAAADSGVAPETEKPKRISVTSKRVIPAPTVQEKEIMASPADQKKEPGSAGEPASLAAVASAATQPLKITVVLGARTLARAEALAQETTAMPDSNLLAKEKPKKKKLRLRIHPDTSPQTDSQLATIKPVSSDIGLGTRIKF